MSLHGVVREKCIALEKAKPFKGKMNVNDGMFGRGEAVKTETG